jgi:hypothetical protein
VRSARPPGVSAITFLVSTSSRMKPATFTCSVTPPSEIHKRASCGVVGSNNRDGHLVAGQGWDQHVIAVGCANRALVEDHCTRGPLRSGYFSLQPKVTGSALQQHDLPRDVKAVVVACLATRTRSARLASGLGEVDDHCVGGYVAVAGEVGGVPDALLTVVPRIGDRVR